MVNLSAGLNCYWTRDSRLMFNCIHSDIEDTDQDGGLLVFETRIQFEF